MNHESTFSEAKYKLHKTVCKEQHDSFGVANSKGIQDFAVDDHRQTQGV